MKSVPDSPSNPDSTPADESGDPALLALWERVDAQWEEETVHEHFLQLAAERGELAFAAHRYRRESEAQAKRSHQAEQQLKKLTALAFAQLDASHTPPPDSKRLMTWIALLVSLTLLGSCFYALTL